MKGYLFVTPVLACILSACTQAPVLPDGKAEIFSPYPIINVDGKTVSSPYSVLLNAGEHRLQIQYGTVLWNYLCDFTLQLQAGRRYEVVDHKKQYPITLYRWSVANPLWATRKDALQPTHCEKLAKSNKPE